MNNSENTKTTVYDYLDSQTVSERKAFLEALKKAGIKAGTYRHWINKRANIPLKYHAVINEASGKELSYPVLKLVPVFEC
jgi:hypothetical protein